MNIENLINQINQSLNLGNIINLKLNINNDDFTKMLLNLVSVDKSEISSDMLVNLSDLGNEISQNIPDLLLALFVNKDDDGLIKLPLEKDVLNDSERKHNEDELNSDKGIITISVEVLMHLVANIIKENQTKVEENVEESSDNAKEVTLQKVEIPEPLEESEIIDRKSSVLKMPELIANDKSDLSMFVINEKYSADKDSIDVNILLLSDRNMLETNKRFSELDKQLIEHIVFEKSEKKDSFKIDLGKKHVPIKEVKEAFFNEMFSNKEIEIEDNQALDNLIIMNSPDVVTEEKTLNNKKEELIKVEKLDNQSLTVPIPSEPAKNNKISAYNGNVENKDFYKDLEIAKFDDRIYLKKESPESISMLIETKEIGKFKVNLSLNDGIIKAEVQPNTEQARAYFKENIDKIFAALNSEGINLGQFVLRDNREDRKSEKSFKKDVDNAGVTIVKEKTILKKTSNDIGLSIYV